MQKSIPDQLWLMDFAFQIRVSFSARDLPKYKNIIQALHIPLMCKTEFFNHYTALEIPLLLQELVSLRFRVKHLIQ